MLATRGSFSFFGSHSFPLLEPSAVRSFLATPGAGSLLRIKTTVLSTLLTSTPLFPPLQNSSVGDPSLFSSLPLPLGTLYLDTASDERFKVVPRLAPFFVPK